GAGDLEVDHAGAVLEHLEHARQHVAIEPPRLGGNAQLFEEGVDAAVGLVGLELISAACSHTQSIHVDPSLPWLWLVVARLGRRGPSPGPSCGSPNYASVWRTILPSTR